MADPTGHTHTLVHQTLLEGTGFGAEPRVSVQGDPIPGSNTQWYNIFKAVPESPDYTLCRAHPFPDPPPPLSALTRSTAVSTPHKNPFIV